MDEVAVHAAIGAGGIIYLDAFATMHGPVSGNTMTLTGMRYPPHGDTPADQYSSVLHKVDRSSFLSACHIVSG